MSLNTILFSKGGQCGRRVTRRGKSPPSPAAPSSGCCWNSQFPPKPPHPGLKCWGTNRYGEFSFLTFHYFSFLELKKVYNSYICLFL